MKKFKLGLIGCGFIGQTILRHFKNNVVWIYDLDYSKIVEVKKKFKANFKCLRELDKSNLKEIDLVVECASQEAVKKYAGIILKETNLLIASVGALADTNLFNKIIKIAKKNYTKILVPNGAIGGIDALQSLGTLKKVKLTTIKNPKSLGLDEKTEREVIFSGNAEIACKKFPKNVNVAATLSIFGLGFKDTFVEIISDPNAKRTKHVIEAESDFAKMSFEIESDTSKENPRTSVTAANSIIKTIKNLSEGFVVNV
ncbi:MAG: aspartate dehydrogenase [Candidatus Micrarchaeota archaeon]|nr:aspartate dehydrogenase [Candidatus Micrarchaeota archaeon]